MTDIILKHTIVHNRVPLEENLALGEVALNTYDGNMYFKKSNLSGNTIVQLATANNTLEFNSKTINLSKNSLITTKSQLNSSVVDGVIFFSGDPLDWNTLAGHPTTLSGYGITDGVSISGIQTITNKSIDAIQLTGVLSANQEPAHTGDVSNPAGSLVLTLATINSNTGVFGTNSQIPIITVDGKGRITSISNTAVTPSFSNITGLPTTINGYGITDSSITFSSRPSFVAWSTSHTPILGAIAYADNLTYRYVGNSSAIPDLLGWIPEGKSSYSHFGTNTIPGTTDMYAAIVAAYAYGHDIDGDDELFATSAMIDLTNVYNMKTSNCKFIAIGAGWATNPQFFKVTQGVSEMTFVAFFNCSFEGNKTTNGILVSNAGAVTVNGCYMHGVPLFAVKSLTKATELRVQNCKFEQWTYGETGFDIEVNRTAILIDLSTADYIITNNVCNYCSMGIKTNTQGPGQVIGNHFYNGALATATFETVNATIASRNCLFSNNYIDNGILRVDVSVISSTAGFQLLNNIFLKSGTGTNTYVIEFYNGVSANLNGVSIVGNSFSGSTSGILYTGTYLADAFKLWVISGNSTMDGTTLTGLPSLAQRTEFLVDPTNGWGIKASNIIITPNSVDSNTVFNFARSATFMADYDNNSDASKSVLNFGTNGTVYHQLGDIGWWAFGFGQATGGGPIANMGWSTNNFIINPSNSAGTGVDATKQMIYDTVSATWQFKAPFKSVLIADSTDSTKVAALSAALISTGTTRTFSLPDTSGTLALAILSTALAAGTLALGFTTNETRSVTPNADGVFTTTVPPLNTFCTLIINTSGVTSYNMTFGTGFRSGTAALATGTASGKVFIIRYYSNGSALFEIDRTLAI